MLCRVIRCDLHSFFWPSFVLQHHRHSYSNKTRLEGVQVVFTAQIRLTLLFLTSVCFPSLRDSSGVYWAWVVLSDPVDTSRAAPGRAGPGSFSHKCSSYRAISGCGSMLPQFSWLCIVQMTERVKTAAAVNQRLLVKKSLSNNPPPPSCTEWGNGGGAPEGS